MQELSQMRYQYRMVYPREVYWSHFFLLILAQDYKHGSIRSDVSGLEPAFPPLNQTFVVSWKGVVETSIHRH